MSEDDLSATTPMRQRLPMRPLVLFMLLLQLCLEAQRMGALSASSMFGNLLSIAETKTITRIGIDEGSEAAAYYKHDNSNLTSTPECTDEQREAINRQLMLSKPTSRFQLGWFTCPESSWLEEYFRDADGKRGSSAFLGISIGCNKGQDAVKLARVGSRSATFDVDRWLFMTVQSLRKHYETQKALDGVFICGRTKNEDVDVGDISRDAEVHCVEPLPVNFDLLRETSRALNYSESKGWHLTQAAISSIDGSIKFPRGRPGLEASGLHDCQGSSSSDCVDVPMYSLESYVRKHVNSRGPIDALQIDVEGWDFDVLFGSGDVLDRTKYLEFEYHNAGHWSSLSLVTAIELLETKGFTCYWADKKRLWRITGCIFDFYHDWHGWSNLACVHRTNKELAERMESLFLKVLTQW